MRSLRSSWFCGGDGIAGGCKSRYLVVANPSAIVEHPLPVCPVRPTTRKDRRWLKTSERPFEISNSSDMHPPLICACNCCGEELPDSSHSAAPHSMATTL